MILSKSFAVNHKAHFMQCLIFIFSISVLLAGCSNEPEAIYIDFSRRMIVDQPGNQHYGETYFKVAVGSMISAQETPQNRAGATQDLHRDQ